MTDCKEARRKENSGVKIKKECDYGERCYRKNPIHFQEFEHEHLNLLLNTFQRTGSLPESFKPKISLQTVKDQLQILQRLKPAINSCETEDIDKQKQGNSEKQVDIISSSSNTKEVVGNSRNSVPILLQSDQENNFSSSNTSGNRKRQSTTNCTHDITDNAPQSKKGNNFNSESSSSQNKGSSSSSNKRVDNNMSETTSSVLSSAQHRERMQNARSLSEAMVYMKEAKKRSQGNILDKHNAAAPYYFFLTSATDSKKTHTEHLSLQMFDILDPSLGDLESSLQINFMVEFGWVVAQYHVAGQWGKPLTLLYGEMDVAHLQFPNVTAVEIKCPSPFGSHHTKMCVLSYTDGSIRVCVHTANLVESDWDNRVQGVWLSPRCPALPLDADSTAGESPTNFKQDLIQYLSAYRKPELQPWIGKLRRADFSHINVFFIASIPGSHKGVDSDRWGLTKLASLLRRHAQILPRSGAPPSSWQIIVQCSSIGSLGPQPTSWFCAQVKDAMSSVLGMTIQTPPPIRLVYPSFENVAQSYEGMLGGGCLPYSKKTHDKQPWLQQYLHQWKCDIRHRTRAMPHIKTYTRVSPDFTEIAWFHLTSANMSKAAWGNQTKAGANSILSYEAGVLFLPKFVVGSTSFPIKNETARGVPVFPMPYDLPLTPYSSSDVPWFSDNYF